MREGSIEHKKQCVVDDQFIKWARDRLKGRFLYCQGQGKSGWQEPGEMENILKDLLEKNLYEEDYIDVAVIAMMLAFKERCYEA